MIGRLTVAAVKAVETAAEATTAAADATEKMVAAATTTDMGASAELASAREVLTEGRATGTLNPAGSTEALVRGTGVEPGSIGKDALATTKAEGVQLESETRAARENSLKNVTEKDSLRGLHERYPGMEPWIGPQYEHEGHKRLLGHAREPLSAGRVPPFISILTRGTEVMRAS